MFKEFKVKDILPPIKIKKYSKTPESDGNVPFVSCQTTNNGISTYCDKKPEVNHCITVSTNGNCFDCFWHNYPIIPSSDVEVLSKDGITDDEKISLYLCGLLAPNTSLYSYTNKPKNGKVFETKIVLPVIESSDPDHEYTVDDIDWQYMRDRITELERDRITELDAYLQATGLNDYELTDEDKKLLSLSPESASDEDGTVEGDSEDELRFREFRVDDIFDVVGTKSLDAGAVEFKDEGINFVGRTYENNGVQGKIDRQTYEPNNANTITATVIGNYKYVKYQEEPYYCSQNINKLTLLDKFNYTLNRLSADYLIALIRKFVEQYNGQQGGYKLSELKGYKMLLPIKSDETPDFDYMEKYIRAMEKIVIADVVKYKDKVIAATKSVVA